jgi:hypothetical protein
VRHLRLPAQHAIGLRYNSAFSKDRLLLLLRGLGGTRMTTFVFLSSYLMLLMAIAYWR